MTVDNAFWIGRWRRGETAWHLPRVHPKLQKYWPLLNAPTSSAVFVPLCGKTIDLLWLAERHQRVVACELSEAAVQQFFAAAKLTPQVQTTANFQLYSADNIEIIVGDYFQLTPEQFTGIDYVYDRASLIALPKILRAAYVTQLQTLLPTATTLLITLAYDDAKMNGPPFSVDVNEVNSLWSQNSTIDLLDDHEIIELEPRFAAKGLNSLREVVFKLTWRNC